MRDMDNDTFNALADGLFTAGRLGELAHALTERYKFPSPMILTCEPAAEGIGVLRWEVTAEGEHHFTFDEAALSETPPWLELRAFQWILPLLAHYARKAPLHPGAILINRGDIGGKPGLAYCDNRPDRFLIPDFNFVATGGYAGAREIFRRNRVPWHDRKPVAFWRGSTTGISAGNSWRGLARAKLCDLSLRDTTLFDVGFSDVTQRSEIESAEIRDAGLLRGPVPWQEWNRYKYLIDIDGNTNAFKGLFQRLLTGSPILKVESRQAFVQWYYDELRPWINYVPISADMSDLVDKVRWLQSHDEITEVIGKRGRELTEILSYARELARGSATISAAFRHFNGGMSGAGPFGRVRKWPRRFSF
jgi:hypothetical protein